MPAPFSFLLFRLPPFLFLLFRSPPAALLLFARRAVLLAVLLVCLVAFTVAG